MNMLNALPILSVADSGTDFCLKDCPKLKSRFFGGHGTRLHSNNDPIGSILYWGGTGP